jgi:hypothetical protein
MNAIERIIRRHFEGLEPRDFFVAAVALVIFF